MYHAALGSDARKLRQSGGVRISTNITSFVDGDKVEVSWSGVQRPTNADAVALFFAGDNPNERSPLKFKWAFASSKSYLQTGAGSHTFRLLNQRKDVSFLLFYNVSLTTKFGTGNLLARSAPIGLNNPNDPQHVHLALGVTEGPAVRWGGEPGSLGQENRGSFSTYTRLQMCGAPANSTGWVDPGWLNYAALTGLQPGTRYYYAVGDPAWGFSREFSFVTAPRVGRDASVRFLAVADLGHSETDGSAEIDHDQAKDMLNYTPVDTLQYVFEMFYNFLVDSEAQQGASLYTLQGLLNSAANASLLLLNGDVSYARHAPEDRAPTGQLTQWDVFMHQMEPLVSQMPWMLTEGNHERDWPYSGDRFLNLASDSGGECGVPFWQRFFMPTGPIKWVDAQSQRRSPEWFSFKHGPVHFLHISTEVDFAPGSPQFEFILQDLAAVDRAVTPWVVVNMHRPIYTSSTAGVGPTSVIRVAEDLRAALEPIFMLYQVDLTLAGHDHKYERTCSVYKKTCLQARNAGYKLSWAANPRPPPYWATVALDHGFLRCDVNATLFYCEEVSSMTGKLLDSFSLFKPAEWEADYVVRNLFEQYFISNYSSFDFLEDTGIPSEGYATVYEPIFKALERDTRLLQLYVLNNNSAALKNSVNGADTVQDAWGAIQPIYNITVAIANHRNSSIYTRFYAGKAVLPIFDNVRSAAAAYPARNGVIVQRTPQEMGAGHRAPALADP
ncbi:Metallo-dependent phosphatase [Coccomyxa subellipsoidea C-169]|uniref:Purple acid phosphatase n=1 Tax=Coccomyxa subellipsoidea (strain C-169) TaxID=574566 RepID=I0YTQ3_COCSC|nr:Metallo-dependent phosphatase [Coccomyxa subellipsoidea C-169]EIE21772.1 Metallo-dependent phosphatase [Coccomyxa subellipsoidea C-169]|eukprot:XP_005646316.1 Metallo-dependent phosphatase [Coccomyxa subellipsoidea C-169]